LSFTQPVLRNRVSPRSEYVRYLLIIIVKIIFQLIFSSEYYAIFWNVYFWPISFEANDSEACISS
jgi:hypothetical protein